MQPQHLEPITPGEYLDFDIDIDLIGLTLDLIKLVLKELGEHPDGGAVQVMDGRYGPYVKHAKINATLPKGTEPQAAAFSGV